MRPRSAPHRLHRERLRLAPRSPPSTPPSPPPTTAELLDFDQARHLLPLSRTTLSRLLRAGELPGARRVGKAWRFHRATLLHWIATGTGAPRRGRRR
ncbi:MAG: helix-turn-helix domain-containing protein [Nannocystis sp.]|nr:helix-turn-helix domain-containing protein [Nannocystis sp.]